MINYAKQKKKIQNDFKIIWNASDSPICTSAKLAFKKNQNTKLWVEKLSSKETSEIAI